MRKNKGFALPLVILIVVILVGIGVVGYYIFKNSQKPITKPATGTEWFQAGNTQPITQLQTRPSIELEDNHIGDFFPLRDPPGENYVRNHVDVLTNFGYKWDFLAIDRLDFNEAVETGEYSEFTVTPEQDEVITELVNNGVNIIYCLVYYEPVDIDAPFSFENMEAYSITDPDNEGRFRTEEEIQDYLNYTRFIVGHFKDRIKYYQILNEPLNGIRGQYVKSEDYINLIRRVVPVIKEECPDCKVVVGSVFGLPDEPGCLPTEPTCYEYLFNILESDVMPLVDGISWHPSPELSPEHGGDSYYKYYQETIQEIKDTASAHGFTGEYITEGPTFAVQPVLPHTFHYSDMIAAKYTSRSIIMNLNENVIAIFPIGAGQLKVIAIQNLCNIMAGTEPTDLPIEIQSEATNIESCTFSLSNGDKLVALWTDGVAVDEDPGINAAVTIPNLSATKVTGVDVLEGYQQDVVTSSENGSLVVQNLKVRDYPLVLHISESNE